MDFKSSCFYPMNENNTSLRLKFIIIDDEEIGRLFVETEAAKFTFLQKIGSYSNPAEAIEAISKSQPDIIFLDIEMPGMSGIELIRKKIKNETLPVFITSHPEFALESYDLDAFDYLLKPVSAERFAQCANRLYDFFLMKHKAFSFDEEKNNDFIIIKQGYDKCKIPFNDIVYLEAMRDYTKIITTEKSFLVLSTLSGIAANLPAEIFVQIHRSYIVNTNKIEIVEKNKVLMQSHSLPIGKLYKHALIFK